MRIILKAREGDDIDFEEALLRVYFEKTHVWVHAKRYMPAKEGRKAYLAIKVNLFGHRALQDCNDKVRSDISALRYHGEKRDYKWADYVAKHADCHAIMHAIATHEGYNDFTDREKVTYLTRGVVSSDINQPLANIDLNDDLHDDFEAAQLHVASFIRDQKVHSKLVCPRKQEGWGGGSHDGRVRKHSGIALTDANARKHCAHINKPWYPSKEYAAFTPLQRKKLFLLQREKKARGEDTRKVSTLGTNTADISSVLSSLTEAVTGITDNLKKQSIQLAALKKTVEYNSDEESCFGTEADRQLAPVIENLQNAALARGKLKSVKFDTSRGRVKRRKNVNRTTIIGPDDDMLCPLPMCVVVMKEPMWHVVRVY